ncbi:SdiA-regulated domain-containing protein [Pontibacter akesuensis]|uniref:Uncharacterized protein YjiK n=1 Tax=Pontibacter akesuensis TaxID=388950 RepID=A0A1I7FJ57_9BACT|nr:SdiA-regulated domain-containing protein [Pontibacter akesuensis]GHA61939.1 hypothetical protein GCM10007389_13170 [Pontibacter akesuensis]SFU36219.1 Uncharacterized protein YjiK [Pontibacter akesuensis]
MINIPFKKIAVAASLAGAITFGAIKSFGDAPKPVSTIETTEEMLPKSVVKWELPAALREVSGIAQLPDNLMACVQDEEGAIYLYDLNTKAVKRKIAFAGPGDYEGIAVDGNTAYILRSDGTLIEVAAFLGPKPEVTTHASVLTPEHNTEGLALDKKNNRLLVAGKGFDTRLGDNKGIYAFDLGKRKMAQKPVITIPLAQKQFAAKGKKKKSKYDVFQPSSLEIHPKTGELYLLDAVNERLLVLSEAGAIQRAVDLDKGQLMQPEGLSFDSNGAMYIASEGGKKGTGVIVKYDKGI